MFGVEGPAHEITVWPLLTYASESWTLKQSTQEGISASESWAWRRLLRTSWTEHKTKNFLRDAVQVREENGLVAFIERRQIANYCNLEKAAEQFGDGGSGRRGQWTGSTGKAKDRLDREHQEEGWIDDGC